MTCKILFDCILTQAPSRCSTTVQFVTLAEKLLKQPGVFIYWPIPDYLSEEDKEYYPKDERIRYLPIQQYKDRMKEYARINPDMEAILSFTGPVWDWDVCVTVRTPMVPLMKTLAQTPRLNGALAWSKRIIVIEDMMILSKKPTIAQSAPDIQDRQTIEGYFSADAVFIPAYHEKKWVTEIARQHFSMARLKELQSKLREVCHLEMPTFLLKGEHKYQKGQRKLGLAFVGRLERANARLQIINEILTNQFIMHSPDVHPFVCTVTQNDSHALDDYAIEMRHPKREEFWRICKEEMDVAVYFHVDAEILMGVLEPLCFGVPAIIVEAPWSRGMLGEAYPFYVKGPGQAYALVSAFRDNYDAMYAKFTAWYESWFVPTYTQRRADDNLYDHVIAAILQPPEHAPANMLNNAVVRDLIKHGGEEFTLFDVVDQSKQDFGILQQKKDPEFRHKGGLIWQIPWNGFRLGLKELGYEDASVATGHMRRISHAQS